MTLTALAIGAVACGSAGQAQRPIDEKPIRFVDAQTGAPVERVLLLPQYQKFTGVSTGGGHGPGTTMAEALFVGFPLVYPAGEPIQIRQPDSKGLLLPGAFIGQGLAIKGVTVVAPGYTGAWLWQLWDRPMNFQVPLTSAGDAWSADRDRLLALLAQPRIRGADLSERERKMFSIIPDFNIEVRLTRDDRVRVEQFIRASLR